MHCGRMPSVGTLWAASEPGGPHSHLTYETDAAGPRTNAQGHALPPLMRIYLGRD